VQAVRRERSFIRLSADGGAAQITPCYAKAACRPCLTSLRLYADPGGLAMALHRTGMALKWAWAHRGRLLASGVIIIVFLSVPFVLLAENIYDSGGSKDLAPGSSVLSPPDDGYYGNPTQLSPPDKKSDFCVTAEFLGITPTTPSVTLGILVGVTSYGASELRQLVLQHYKTVSLWITSNSGLSSIQIPIDVSVLEHTPSELSTCGTGNLTPEELDQGARFRATDSGLTILGQSRAFPNDWYELDDSVVLRKGPDVNGGWLPSSLIMMTRDEDFSTWAQIDKTSGGIGDYSHRLMFKVARPWWTIVYTYWIASMPFVLLVVLLAREKAKGTWPGPSALAFGVAAVLVAILPLRSVLVPTSIPGLTRLDIYFGIGIVFLVAGSIVLTLMWTPPHGKNGSDTDPNDQDQSGTTSSVHAERSTA
jgi:hypothetical protein